MSSSGSNGQNSSKNDPVEGEKGAGALSFKDWKTMKDGLDKKSSPIKKGKEQHNKKRNSNLRSNSGPNNIQTRTSNRNVNMFPPPLMSLGVANTLEENLNQYFGNSGNNSFAFNNMMSGFCGNMNSAFEGFNNMNGNFNNNTTSKYNSNNMRNNGFNNNMNSGFGNDMNYGSNSSMGRAFGNCNMNNSNSFRQNNNMSNGFNNDLNSGYSMPDNFFKTDGFYDQKDMIKKTMEENPFRNSVRGRKMFDDMKNSAFKNKDEQKRMPNKIKPNRNNQSKEYTASDDIIQKREPKIFIKNSRTDSYKHVQIPKPPESEIKGTLEDRKREWKEYRDAMKPFKNREFYNAKRVVQRLGKKDPSELDEKDKFRLANAQERMAFYKQRLADKYDGYVPSPNKGEAESGELFVLKKSIQDQWNAKKTDPDQFGNNANFGESYDFSSGRKILGAGSNFKYPGFVSGGTMTSITQY
uniref:Uncharacterized protein n=1 Tax=Stomoxys calcitrans TaxID=35570 RepID=A0A1I8PX14_STOCA